MMQETATSLVNFSEDKISSILSKTFPSQSFWMHATKSRYSVVCTASYSYTAKLPAHCLEIKKALHLQNSNVVWF